MRNAILQMPDQRTANEHRQVLRAALRQLSRAEVYIAAVAYMESGDAPAEKAISKLRSDLNAVYRHLAEKRSEIRL
jgi:hypothetical protein